jgi:hypothetical protein
MIKKLIKWVLKTLFSLTLALSFIAILFFPFYNIFVPKYVNFEDYLAGTVIIAVFIYYITKDKIIDWVKRNWD